MAWGLGVEEGEAGRGEGLTLLSVTAGDGARAIRAVGV